MTNGLLADYKHWLQTTTHYCEGTGSWAFAQLLAHIFICIHVWACITLFTDTTHVAVKWCWWLPCLGRLFKYKKAISALLEGCPPDVLAIKRFLPDHQLCSLAIKRLFFNIYHFTMSGIWNTVQVHQGHLCTVGWMPTRRAGYRKVNLPTTSCAQMSLWCKYHSGTDWSWSAAWIPSPPLIVHHALYVTNLI